MRAASTQRGAAWADFLTATATTSSFTRAPCQSSLLGQLPVQPDSRLLDRGPRQVQVTAGVLDQGLIGRAESVEERPAGLGPDQVVIGLDVKEHRGSDQR